MRRLGRIFLYLVLVLLVLSGAGIAYLYYGLPKDQIVADISEKLRQTTGRDVTIEGTPEIVLWPRPGIRTGAVTITNAAWASGPNLISADAGLVTVSLDGLMQGELLIGALHLTGGTVSLERDGQGRVNWPWAGRAEGTALNELRLQPDRLDLRDPFLPSSRDIKQADLTILLGEARHTAEFSGILGLDGEDIALSGRIGNLDAFLAGGWSRVALTAYADDLEADWIGSAAIGLDQPYPYVEGRLEAEGSGLVRLPLTPWHGKTGVAADLTELKVDADLTVRAERFRLRSFTSADFRGVGVSLDLRVGGESGWQDSGASTLNAVSRAAGLYSLYLDGPFDLRDVTANGLTLSGSVIDLPGLVDWSGLRLPSGMGLPKAINMSGQVGLAPDVYTIVDANIGVGDQRYPVQASLETGEPRPRAKLSMDLAQLDISQVAEISSAGWRVKVPQPSDVPDNGADITLALDIDQLIMGEKSARGIALELHSRPDTLALSVASMRMFGGEVSLDTLSDAGGRSVLAVQMNGLSAEDLFKSFGWQGLEGAVAGDLQLQLPGNGAVEAQGSVSVFGGTVHGQDLFAVARGESDPPEGTSFSALSADISLSEQVMTLSHLRLSNLGTELQGGGTLDLGSAAVTGTLTPSGGDGQALYPVTISGGMGRIEARADGATAVVSSTAPTEVESAQQPAAQPEPLQEASDEQQVTSESDQQTEAEVSQIDQDTAAETPSEPTGPASAPVPVPAPR